MFGDDVSHRMSSKVDITVETFELRWNATGFEVILTFDVIHGACELLTAQRKLKSKLRVLLGLLKSTFEVCLTKLSVIREPLTFSVENLLKFSRRKLDVS